MSSTRRWDDFYSPSQMPAADTPVTSEMLVDPTVHQPSISVAEIRELFQNHHQQMILLVDGGRLVATVERSDLEGGWPSDATGETVGTLAGRVIAPGARLSEAARMLDESGGRRLAVVGDGGKLLGLLCLKSSRAGFCSEQDVRDHRDDVRGHGPH